MTLSVHGTSSQVQAAAVASSTIALPTNSYGDLLIICVAHADDTATGLTGPGNWNQLAYMLSLTGGGQVQAIYSKVSSGSETNPTFTIVGGTPSNQFWASTAGAYSDSSGNQPVIDQLLQAEDTVGPTLVTPMLAPTLDGSVVVSFVCSDQNAGAAPSIGSVSTTSGYALTKEKDVIGGGAMYAAMADEIQTTTSATAHTYNYTGAGTAARGAAMCIVSIGLPSTDIPRPPVIGRYS